MRSTNRQLDERIKSNDKRIYFFAFGVLPRLLTAGLAAEEVAFLAGAFVAGFATDLAVLVTDLAGFEASLFSFANSKANCFAVGERK